MRGGKTKFARWAALSLAAAMCGLLPPFAAEARADAWDWLVQKVCVDGSNRPLPLDPYYGCQGHTMRALQPGDPLPYHKYDSGYAGQFQRHDSYPIVAPNGTELVINPFDYGASPTDPAMEGFKPGSDGYDIYEVAGGWASASETRDGGGFSTTFFGSGCAPYNGWIFFPSDVAAGASSSASVPIYGRYWEKDSENWPGACSSSMGTSETDWYWEPQWAFGDNGGTIKPMDTIIVIHGYEPNIATDGGHLEVFYFTQYYGVTRWEAWTPTTQNPTPTTSSCAGPRTYSRYGLDFVVTDCRDWSNVNVLAAPAAPAVWPVPDQNLLANFHFGDGVASWNRSGNSAEGTLINWALDNSSLYWDTLYSQTGTGVRYLATNCAGTCTGAQYIFQDLPVSGRTPSGDYTLAVTAKTEGGQGTLQLSLWQLDASGNLLATAAFTSPVQASYPAWTGDSNSSVVLNGGFISGTVNVQLAPGATTLRFLITPMTANTFDIVDAWLVPTLSNPATTNLDIGLRMSSSAGVLRIAGGPAAQSPLKVNTANGTFGVVLVSPNDPAASPLKIQTAQGTFALKKL